MKPGLIIFILTLFCSASISMAFPIPSTPLPPQDVILITIDGVQKSRVDQMTFLNQMVKQSGLSFGFGLKPMHVSNRSHKSLPGYRALLSGQFEESCKNNECPVIDRQTLFDQLPSLGISREQAVVFASWEKIEKAVSQNPETLCGSIGFKFLNYCTQNARLIQTFETIFKEANQDRPSQWHDSRWDRYTWDLALNYLVQERPRFTYLSFVDTDEWAHHKNFTQVNEALSAFDHRFSELISLLIADPSRFANTSIIITTDHGRGKGISRFTHGKFYPNSKNIFTFVLPSSNILARYTIKEGKRAEGLLYYQQTQIKPTLEWLLNPKTHAPSEASLIEATLKHHD